MFGTIRARVLAAALLPVALVVPILVVVFWSSRAGDLEDAHRQRARLLLRQVAMGSEYGLFSGNVANLQGVVNAARQESDVHSVSIFDAQGQLLARAGSTPLQALAQAQSPAYVGFQADQGVEVLTQRIESGGQQVEDLYSAHAEETRTHLMDLGVVVVELSSESLTTRKREILRVALLIGLFGMVVGGILALRLARGVVQPVVHVSTMIERIGSGDLSVHAMDDPREPLYELQVGLAQMARRLAWGRDELEQQVAQVTQELRLKKEEAEAATLTKSRFLAAASHDLRQPMHALGMFIARLGQLPMEEEPRQLVDKLLATVHALQNLLDGLLDLSRLESGTVLAQMRPVSIAKVFEATSAALAPQVAAKGLRLRVRPTPLWGMTDAMLLQRMVMNLVHNAIRYTEKGTVLLACRLADQGQRIHIEVWDSGIGISPLHQADIFKEFFQVDGSQGMRRQGLGLGLNIVERSAQLLGHTVWLRSELGRGTRFSIAMARAEALAAEPTTLQLPQTVHRDSLQRFSVLLLEQDRGAGGSIEELLCSWGCSVVVAHGLLAADGRLRAGLAPDAVIYDCQLEAPEGPTQVLEWLRRRVESGQSVCLLGSETDDGLAQAGKAAGMSLLAKPVRPAKLRALLRRMAAAAQPVERL